MIADETLNAPKPLDPVPTAALTPQKVKPTTAAPAPAPAPTMGLAGPGSTITSTAANVPGAVPATPVPATPTPAAPVTPTPAAGLGPGAQGTPTDPQNPLTTQTISRNPTVDRFKLAQDRFQAFTEASEPAYQAALRQATQRSAAAGGLGSGMLRTDYGNLANQRDLNLRTAQSGFLNNALEGTIADSFGDVAIGQQQQGFQNQQQQQAFENELRRLGFDDAMINSAFGRALQTFNAGQAGGTGAGSQMAVGGQIAGQGQDALDALAELIRTQNAIPTTGGVGGTPPFNPNTAGADTRPWWLQVGG